MKRQIILIFSLFGLLVQCKDAKKQNESKTELIFAENNYDLTGNIKLNIYSDSTYTFTVINDSPNHLITEIFNGFCFQKSDTIYFKPFEFKFNKSEKAVIKNSFIEFVDGKYPLKIEIKKNEFKIKNSLDFTNFADYAIFTFDQKFYPPSYYNYKPNTISAYNINQSELHQINEILKKCFSENRSQLRNINNYVKQCIVVINSKKEKQVWVSCFCKSFHIEKEFKYSIIDMHDGGNCNLNLKINLTKNNYSDLNIAGQA